MSPGDTLSDSYQRSLSDIPLSSPTPADSQRDTSGGLQPSGGSFFQRMLRLKSQPGSNSPNADANGNEKGAFVIEDDEDGAIQLEQPGSDGGVPRMLSNGMGGGGESKSDQQDAVAPGDVTNESVFLYENQRFYPLAGEAHSSWPDVV